MKSIYKYPIKRIDDQAISIPKNSRLLRVVPVKDELVLYVLVDIHEKQTDTIAIKVFPTGYNIDINTDSWTYLDSIVVYTEMVVHIFYK
jgi:hypothetical protein